MEKWYKKHQVRSLVDMHIPNGEGYMEKYDPARYAENVKKSGATCAYLAANNCLGLCFYPTEVGLRHKEACRDLFGETVKECRKRGLDVIGYTNTWATFLVDQKPEWGVVYADGSTRRDTQRFGTPCVNNDEYVDYVCARSAELVTRYKLDGFWLDMIGIAAPVCHCQSCRTKFEKKYGKPLPTLIDKNSPDIYEYLEFKAAAVENYLSKVKAAVKQADPEITVAFQSASVARHPLSYGTGSCLELSEYLSGDFYTNRPGVNVICRMLYKATNNLPFEFMTSRCVSLERHTMNKDIHELINQSYAALMYKGAFLFIDAIDPDGEMNSRFYEDVSVISRNMEKYLPYIDFQEEAVREVAVYYNDLSWLPRGESPESVKELRNYGFYEDLEKLDNILAASHIDYDLIGQRRISELTRYKTVIFPSLSAISEQEAEAIRQFVAEGGSAYISGITSLYNDKGIPNDNFMLADLLGVDYKGRFDVQPGYLAPTQERPELFGTHTRKYPHMLEERLVKVVPNTDGRVLATVTLPVGDVKDHLCFSSAISDPPIIETEYPAILEHTYGKGRVIYSAGFLENDPMPDSAQLLSAIIGELTGPYTVTVTAPKCVDHTAYRKDGYMTVHLLNSQTIYPPISIGDINVAVKLDAGSRVSTVQDITGGKLSYSVNGDTLTVHTDLDVYKFFRIEFEK